MNQNVSQHESPCHLYARSSKGNREQGHINLRFTKEAHPNVQKGGIWNLPVGTLLIKESTREKCIPSQERQRQIGKTPCWTLPIKIEHRRTQAVNLKIPSANRSKWSYQTVKMGKCPLALTEIDTNNQNKPSPVQTQESLLNQKVNTKISLDQYREVRWPEISSYHTVPGGPHVRFGRPRDGRWAD